MKKMLAALKTFALACIFLQCAISGGSPKIEVIRNIKDNLIVKIIHGDKRIAFETNDCAAEKIKGLKENFEKYFQELRRLDAIKILISQLEQKTGKSDQENKLLALYAKRADEICGNIKSIEEQKADGMYGLFSYLLDAVVKRTNPLKKSQNELLTYTTFRNIFCAIIKKIISEIGESFKDEKILALFNQSKEKALGHKRDQLIQQEQEDRALLEHEALVNHERLLELGKSHGLEAQQRSMNAQRKKATRIFNAHLEALSRTYDEQAETIEDSYAEHCKDVTTLHSLAGLPAEESTLRELREREECRARKELEIRFNDARSFTENPIAAQQHRKRLRKRSPASDSSSEHEKSIEISFDYEQRVLDWFDKKRSDSCIKELCYHRLPFAFDRLIKHHPIIRTDHYDSSKRSPGYSQLVFVEPIIPGTDSEAIKTGLCMATIAFDKHERYCYHRECTNCPGRFEAWDMLQIYKTLLKNKIGKSGNGLRECLEEIFTITALGEDQELGIRYLLLKPKAEISSQIIEA